MSIEGRRDTKAFLADAGIRVGAVVAVRARADVSTLVVGDVAVAIDPELAKTIAVREHVHGG